jgi:hypothetical protein
MFPASDNIRCGRARSAIADGYPGGPRLTRTTTQILPVTTRNGAPSAGKGIPNRPSALVSGRPRDFRRLQIRRRSLRGEALWIACHMLCGTAIALVLVGLFPSLATLSRRAEQDGHHDSDALGATTPKRRARSNVRIRIDRPNEMVALAAEGSPP